MIRLSRFVHWNPRFTRGVITKIEDVECQKAVRRLEISVDSEMKYLPGQWVDLAPVDNDSRLLGVSMVNHDPKLLKFAIQISEHETVQYLHNKAKINTALNLRVGEDMSFAMKASCLNKNILFLTAGIGITPCLSMFEYLAENRSKRKSKSTDLIYLLNSESDLIFEKEIEQATNLIPNFKSKIIYKTAYQM